MQSVKHYDWKDSNMENFGTVLERSVKKESAKSERAWQGSGQEVGLEIWRIVNFQVEIWPTEQHGQFYDGDSYIVLNTYKKDKKEALYYNVHFWIGRNSAQDEYCTAAYKTVELDTFHDDKPVQHREVQGNESDLFKSYFKDNTITYLTGGADSGFRHIARIEEYKPRLFHFRVDQSSNVKFMKQVALRLDQLDPTDAFLLDTGLKVFTWFTGECTNRAEKSMVLTEMNRIKSERGGKVEHVALLNDEIESDEEFLKFFENEDEKEEVDAGLVGDIEENRLFRLSDESGEMVFSFVCCGETPREKFESKDVFILDKPGHCYVWIGSGASVDEQSSGFLYAHSYLMEKSMGSSDGDCNPFKPVSLIRDGEEPEQFFD